MNCVGHVYVVVNCVNDSIESGRVRACCWYGGKMLPGGRVLRVGVLGTYRGEGVAFTFHFATLRGMCY